jgi:HD-GYP domain-containing protein (c-di-GMP phosphodiesterase class II)
MFNISPVSLMRSMTLALDLAVDGVGRHQQRVAFICRGIAEEVGMPVPEMQVLLCAALMHDIGAASQHDERRKIADPNTESRLGEGLFAHAENGYLLLRDSQCLARAALPVRCHHDHWQGGNLSGFVGDRIPLVSRIIHLADRIEIRIKNDRPILSQKNEVLEYAKKHSGITFDPALVETFLACSRKESFWLDVINHSYTNDFYTQLDWGRTPFTGADMLQVAELYATIIDRMSPFTATHSRSVSEVAVLLARHHGFCNHELYLMKITGLLHDLGKLSVPNSILEKPGKLDPSELLIMRQHTYYTYRILEQTDELKNLAGWAAWHHETLDGQGYPFKINGDFLPLAARIMAVADIFVALAEQRPYRGRMELDRLSDILRDMAANNKITAGVVASVLDLRQEAQSLLLSMCDSLPAPKPAAYSA